MGTDGSNNGKTLLLQIDYFFIFDFCQHGTDHMRGKVSKTLLLLQIAFEFVQDSPEFSSQ